MANIPDAMMKAAKAAFTAKMHGQHTCGPESRQDAAIRAALEAAGIGDLTEAVKDALYHLEAATSSYREFSGNKDKTGKRDALYSTRLADYEAACGRVRATYLKATGGK